MITLRRLFSMPLLCVLAFSSCNKEGSEDEGNSNGGGSEATRGTASGHEWVNLGLPSGTKWAANNVGTEKPEGLGERVKWGEPETKETVGSVWSGVEYSDLKAQKVIDANGNLTASYDVATVNWGNDWRMPTSGEIEELLTLNNESTTVNGVKGRKFIGNNGNSLFIPYTDWHGRYWSATAKKDREDGKGGGVYILDMYPDNIDAVYCHSDGMNNWYSVRPVLKTK